jgi:hypothetical protein
MLRTINSGLVLLPRIAAMHVLRCSGVLLGWFAKHMR